MHARPSPLRDDRFRFGRSVLAEPLVQFLLLGSLVFVLHRALASDTSAEQQLTIDAHRRRELLALFEQRQRRKPSAREAEQVVERWIEEEALLHEATRLDLQRQDPVLRDQIIARTRALLQASISVPSATDRELDAYYAAHRERYLQPATASFTEYLIPSGSRAEDTARELLRRLGRGEPVTEVPVRHNARALGELDALYGPELSAKLSALELDKWLLLRSRAGLHVVKLESRTAASAPSREELRPRLLDDLTAERTRERFQQRLGELTARWRSARDGAP